MSRKAKIVGAMTFLLLLLLLVASSLAQAERQEESFPEISGLATPTPKPELEGPYLIWLQLPEGECPECLGPGPTMGFYMEQLRAAQRPILGTLARLKSEGLVSDFRPLLGAIQVNGADPKALSTLATLPGVSQITPAGAEEVAAAQQAAQNAMRQGARETAREVAAQGEVPLSSTNPSVYVDETYNWVDGDTYDYEPVTVVLKDYTGAVKETRYTGADDWGWYWVWFWEDIIPGDRVEVTAAGNTVTVIVAALSAHLNVDTDMIWGTGPASKNMWVGVWGQRGCYWDGWSESTSSDGSGNYSVDFSGLWDIVRGDDTVVYSYDAAGNATYIYRYAHIVQVEVTYGVIYGYTDPYASVSAVLKDSGGSIKATASETAWDDGWYGLWLGDMEVGDRVEVTTAGETHTVYIKNLTVRVDSDTDVASGEGPEGDAQLVLWPYLFDYSRGYWRGWWACQTVTTTSSSPYTYTIDFSSQIDIAPGDFVDVYYTDLNGHQLVRTGYAPIVYVENGGNVVWGYVDGGVPVTVTVKTGGDVTKATASTISASSGYIWFSLLNGDIPLEIITGDTVYVEASPPITVPVVSLTATLNTGTDTLSGSAPPYGDLYMWAHHWMGSWYYWYYKYATAGADGSYSVNYSGWVNLVTGDYADVYYINGEGNRVYVNAYTTNPMVTVTSYPPVLGEGLPGTIQWSVTNGVRVQYTFVYWDVVSHPGDDFYSHLSWRYPYSGGMGTYSAHITGPSFPNTVYFRVFAYVDGRSMWTPEYAVPVVQLTEKVYLPLIMKNY